MSHVEVSVNFLEAPIFVSEVAAFTVWAKLFTIELPAVLGLVLLVESCLGLGDSIDLFKFFTTMGILALVTVSAETDLGPILAHFSLVFLCIQR